MDVDFVRGVCRKLPHVTEQVQWGADLVFKIGGKMFAVTPLEPPPTPWRLEAPPDDASGDLWAVGADLKRVRSGLPSTDKF